MLGKYEWEVLEQMDRSEFLRWNALIEIEYKERKRNEARAKAKMKATRRSR